MKRRNFLKLGALTSASLQANRISSWGLDFAGRFNTVPVRAAHALPAIFGLAAVFIGWLRLGVRPLTELWHTFALWVLPLLVCPPLLSKDAWAYLEQGWIVLQAPSRTSSLLRATG